MTIVEPVRTRTHGYRTCARRCGVKIVGRASGAVRSMDGDVRGKGEYVPRMFRLRLRLTISGRVQSDATVAPLSAGGRLKASEAPPEGDATIRVCQARLWEEVFV